MTDQVQEEYEHFRELLARIRRARERRDVAQAKAKDAVYHADEAEDDLFDAENALKAFVSDRTSVPVDGGEQQSLEVPT